MAARRRRNLIEAVDVARIDPDNTPIAEKSTLLHAEVAEPQTHKEIP
jgi:hypothetical protein